MNGYSIGITGGSLIAAGAGVLVGSPWLTGIFLIVAGLSHFFLPVKEK